MSLNALFEIILFSDQNYSHANASCNISTTLLAFNVLSKFVGGDAEQTMAFYAIYPVSAKKIITAYVTPFVSKLSSSISQSVEETK